MSDRAQISLREGGPDDLDEVMQVMEESFDPVFGEAWTLAQCAGLLPMPGVWLTIAQHGDEVAGFALARIVLREAELLLLAVSKGQQRAGTGRRLLEAFVDVAVGRGADCLHLEVREGNEAVELYKTAGFTEVGRRKNYYNGSDGQLYDALTLSRTAKF